MSPPPNSDTSDFYARLPSLESFLDVTDLAKYHRAPDDWSLVVTDVQGSTKAIEAGRYKDVNAVGVASIVAIQNALPGVDLPFVFGGDGATVLVPNSSREAIHPALRGARERARTGLGLELRAGVVAVEELRAAGHEVLLARMAVSRNAAFAMFAGDGLSAAERWVKHPERGVRYAVSEEGPAQADFEGFECRWQPLPTRRGKVASILVHALGRGDAAHQTYRAVVSAIETIVGDATPVSKETLKLASDQSAFHQEAVLLGGAPGSVRYRVRKLKVAAQNALGRRLVAKHGVMGSFDGARYPAEVAENSDYRKFDDTLRMVLDVTPEELDQIAALLEEKRKAGLLAFGIHASQAALMTCIVRKYEGEHVHFIDGADGGYALAAKQLKAQLK
jgi:hypothetical protein